MTRRTNRREFLKQSAAAGVGFWVAGGLARVESKSPNGQLNIACIGVGGKGDSDSSQAGNHGRIVALCDIDDNPLNHKAQQFPDAEKFHDFREMLEKLGNKIDAVTVSTPDHTHAAAAITAMKRKKHVYCQKPLTHTVYEARRMREVANEYKVCTQMGNQGTAANGLRRAVEILRDGVIGPVREVHVWTNRPIWPQAPQVTARPKDTPPPPKHVHWDLFLGPAPFRPWGVFPNGVKDGKEQYRPAYHPFVWRGWWDFGTGALGDMGCHTANMAFMALKLGHPSSIEAESGPVNPETYPGWAKVTYHFPARDSTYLPAVKVIWYEGHRDGKRVLPPTSLIKGRQFSDSGSLLVGDGGILFSPNDYGEQYDLLPEEKFKGYKGPKEYLPRNGHGDDGMKAEWVRAIKENKPSIAMSNFNYAGMLTEFILLGNVAIRAGKKLEWDGPNLKFRNAPEADKYLRTHYRKGWTL